LVGSGVGVSVGSGVGVSVGNGVLVGVGVIVGAAGRGSDARVQVNFRDAGVKWLALEYAKLEAA